MKALCVALLLTLAGCKTLPAPVQVKTVEVIVETQVPIDAKLTAQVPAPKRPANRCKDGKGRDTLCNRDLATWLVDYATALDKANAKLKAILGLQPKP